ncbi:GIY-YIG nuclease family protein [Marinoscillum sp.]|uniref:GIY-YIG nuclease family protein n=1 Tax=Marinoscillum sp. TaxID=2024838 RepID=UPI003BACB3D6
MPFFVYILYSESADKYYKGQTNNLEDRLKRHNAGAEVATVKGRPWKVVWSTEKESRSEAIILEKKLKNMNRLKLKSFIDKYS